MKKLLVMLLAVATVLSICAVVVSANDVCEPVEYRDADGNIIGDAQNGLVPKIVGQKIEIDGKMESAYLKGLHIQSTRLMTTTGNEPTGEGYLIYDDNYLYVFITVTDPNVYHITPDITICPVCGKQRSANSGCEEMAAEGYAGDSTDMWNDDCIEFMIDWANDGSTPSQYRVSRDGWMSKDWDTANTGFSAKGYDGSANGETNWYAEFAFPLDSSAKGTQLGITFMEVSWNDGSYDYSMFNNSTATGGPWDSTYFDYIELGDELQVEDEGFIDPYSHETKDEADLPGATSAASGNDAGGDNIVLVVIAAIASLAGAVIVKKTCFSK